MMFTRMAFRGIWLAVFFSGFLGMANTVYAGSQLWSHKFDKDVQWHRVTDVGNFLVGTENGIYCFDSEVGEVAWSREDLAKIPEFNVEEIKGTPFLLVSEVEGKVNVKTTLHAVNVLTGEDVWKTDAVKGVGVDAVPIPSKGFVLLMTTPFAVPKEKLGLVALDLGTGDVVWESQFEEKVDLTIAEGSGKWFAKYDLSGHQPPVVEGDAIYFTYAGLHRYNLGTGSLVWGLKYDVTEKNLKRANAQPVIDGEVIYTSAKGEIRAIDKNSGGLMWKSKKKFGGAVAEVASMGEVLLCRTGGNFYDGMKREWDLKKPLGVAAVDKSTGETIWKYDDAKDSITNMVVLKDAGLVLIADAKNLIGLDATNRDKKPQEVFKEKLEFKDKMGAKGVAGKALKFKMGGLRGLRGGGNKGDHPVAISMQQGGIAVVRGKQHLLAFDPVNRSIVWSAKYQAPGVSGWSKLAMGAVSAFAYAEATNRATNSAYGSSTNRWANADRWQAIGNYEAVAGKRFSATEATKRYAYILTEIEEGEEKGAGIVGVNLDTGETERQVLLDDKEPDYKVDEVTGRVFNVKKKKELIVFSVE